MTQSLLYSLVCISLCIVQPHLSCWAAENTNAYEENSPKDSSEDSSPDSIDNDNIDDILEDDQEEDSVLHTLFEHKGKVSIIALLAAAGIYNLASAQDGKADNKDSDPERKTNVKKAEDNVSAQHKHRRQHPAPPRVPEAISPYLQGVRDQLTRLGFIPPEFIQRTASQDAKRTEGGWFTFEGVQYQLRDGCLYQIRGNGYQIKLVETKEGQEICTGMIELSPNTAILPKSIVSAIDDRFNITRDKKKSIWINNNLASIGPCTLNTQTWMLLHTKKTSATSAMVVTQYFIAPPTVQYLHGVPIYDDGIQFIEQPTPRA